MSITVREITNDELEALRGKGQYSETFLIPRIPNIIYTALLNGVPSSSDMVTEINYDGGSGTLGDVRLDMKLLVGSSAGASDIGFCRIRKAPTSDKFYIGELSHIKWVDNCHLTVVDDYDLFPKHIKIVDAETLMDVDIAYSDQHTDFDPVVCMGGHVVLPFTGDPVTLERTCEDSWVFDGTIASILWEAPGSSNISGDTTDTVTIEWDAAGHYAIYCTLTTNDGKTYFGVRYVFVVDESSFVYPIHSDLRRSESISDSGHSFAVDLYDHADYSTFPKRAFVIVYEKATYDGVPGSIYYVDGEKNILGYGRVTEESMSFNEELGNLSLSIAGYHRWLKELSCFPAGIEDRGVAPSVWTDMSVLTVDKAVWHILHWRSTATRLFDFYPSGDSRMASELQSLSSKLWAQIQEVTMTSIFAELIFEPTGRAFLRVEPQLVPPADRSTWPVVQDITPDDWQGVLQVEVNTITEVSRVDLSGIALPEIGNPSALFSMANGHIPKLHGDIETIDRLLLESQTKANSLSGLMIGWKDAELEYVRVQFIGNHRMFSIAQYCYASIDIPADSNIRGLSYNGNLVPRDINYAWDGASGYASTTITFQPESVEEISINGDIPAEAGADDFDTSIPNFPTPNPVPIPPYDYIDPGIVNNNHPRKVIGALAAHGVVWTDNFHEDEAGIKPTWKFMNNGLDAAWKLNIAQLVVTPSGAMYMMTDGSSAGGWSRIVRASGLGATWQTVFLATTYSSTARITGLGVNPNVSDQVAIVVGDAYINFGTLDTHKIYVGSGSSFSAGGYIRLKHSNYQKGVVFWKNHWIVAGHRPTGIGGSLAATVFWTYNSSGGLVGAANGAFWGSGAGATVGDCHALTGPKLILWGGNTTSDYTIVAALDGSGNTDVTTGIHPTQIQNMAISPTGVMAVGNDGSTPYKSTDSLATWSSLAGGIPIGSDVWADCKDNNRFLFGGGIVLRDTLDHGTTYTDKFGNLGHLAGLYDVILLRYIS